jgi:hypothetical protein
MGARRGVGERLRDGAPAEGGTLVDVSIAAAPVRDATGRVVGNMVAYTDIRERRAQAAEVHRLNDELHAKLDELAASRARMSPPATSSVRFAGLLQSPLAERLSLE